MTSPSSVLLCLAVAVLLCPVVTVDSQPTTTDDKQSTHDNNQQQCLGNNIDSSQLIHNIRDMIREELANSVSVALLKMAEQLEQRCMNSAASETG